MCVCWHRWSRARVGAIAMMIVVTAASAVLGADNDSASPDRSDVLEARVEALVDLADP